MQRAWILVFVLSLLTVETQASRLAYRPRTGICKAAADGDLKALEAFLDANPKSVMELDNGASPLYWAATCYQVDAVKLLLARGAAINFRSDDEWTALHTAAFGGSAPTVQVLLLHGANVNVTNNAGATPLGLACAYGRDVETVRLLLEHNADPNLISANAASPLQSAAFHGEHGICALLIQHGAEVNAHGFQGATALHWAVDGEKLDMVKFLLANGANPPLLDDNGKSALDWAEERAAKKRWRQRSKLRGIAKLLRRAPAPPSATKSSHGKR